MCLDEYITVPRKKMARKGEVIQVPIITCLILLQYLPGKLVSGRSIFIRQQTPIRGVLLANVYWQMLNGARMLTTTKTGNR